MGNQEKHYYMKLEDFKILSMFGECEIDVTNSKVKIELDKIEKRRSKKIEIRKQKKIRDLGMGWDGIYHGYGVATAQRIVQWPPFP